MSAKKKIVVCTGAGISAESGISTFRDAGGLWEGHDVQKVASPQGWAQDPAMVLEFYNQRRQNVREVVPNAAHYALAKLEEKYDVMVITQNIDDLHERGGSTRILHLHGQIRQARSTADPNLVYDLGDKDISLGDVCEKGSQLRPHIVWFGEDVPEFSTAVALSILADILIIIGTSMVVYPANTLFQYTPAGCEIILIDPNKPAIESSRDIRFVTEKATIGVPKVVEELLARE